MKKKIFTGLITGLFITGMANMADAAIYGGVDFPDGAASFADEWISYEPTSGVLPPHNDPAAALGIPDYYADANYVSLGDEGVLVVKFIDNSLTTSWDNSIDLWIFEIGSAIEPTSVDISANGSDWINVGQTSGGKYGIDIDNYVLNGVVLGAKYSYVRLTDLLPHQSGSPFEGADIDAIGAISSAPPVPIPGAIWLLGSGIAGISALRRRKK